MLKRTVLALAVAALVSSVVPARAQNVQFAGYPEGPGMDILRTKCRVCHMPDRVKQKGRDKESWDAFRNGADVYAWSVPGLYDAVAQHPDYVVVNQFMLKPYGIIYDKNDLELGRVLNTIIAEMRASGELDRLYAKWFGVFGGPSSR